MIDRKNFKSMLKTLKFVAEGNTFTKSIGEAILSVDFAKESISYPEKNGFKVNERQVCNLSANENFVVFECVHRLLEKGYKPKHLELEPRWQVGRGASGGRADILVKDQQNKPLLLIECKTEGGEFEKEWKNMQGDGGQLFGYAQQIPETQFLCLYASDFADGKTVPKQKIISHKDNPKILEGNRTLPSFAKATDVKSRFAVWRDTYQLEHTESGIFEDNVQPYQIGKSKYTLSDDTKSIGVADTQGKYHEFRTILRKHNIARRENAFEVLVNLFLCKIVDEDENGDDLKFYWKGIAYDNYFDFVDRLQDLYRKGMRKFLNEEISYISNEQIDQAFWAVKNNRNATKQKIQAYFRELKFFTNSAFSFIDTHNEELFSKNAKVLLEVVQMWQGLRLKTNEQNQFLGDMFEYFLDNSIKQSNGQFFTPLPICKFIVASLPLREKIQAGAEPLKTIDYACGSGHFLTEYARQIEPLVKAKKQDLKIWHGSITGVEKEDRLAKVAKVSAYMYGQEQIKILDVDALAGHPEIPLESFDVLVANPPFAVEGFLQTLSDRDKACFELVKATSDTNAIQCFFLERMRHLMAPGGVVGVIVPSSILSNADVVHIRTRELLLKFFDFVSIAEFGGGTFGKTGTNTVVLFLRRKTQRPEAAEHYRNRVDDFFDGDTQSEIYQDLHLVKAYCSHIEVPYGEYKNLFGPTDMAQLTSLFEYDIFKDYRRNFAQSTEIKNLKKSNPFKKKTKAQQQAELDRRFIAHLHKIEKDKLYYFILAHEQAGKVLIVNTPDGSGKQKQFLGYEWSSAKGSEGIKYNGGETVNDIVTPLFDPKDLDKPGKINTAIKHNFSGEVTDPLPEQCRYAKLTDMLDFTRKDFTKIISLNPKQNIGIETKWDLTRLGEVADVIIGGTPPRKNPKYFSGQNVWVSIAEMNNQVITDTKEKITDEGVKNSNAKLIPEGTCLLSFKLTIGKTAIAGTDLYTNEAIAGLIPKSADIDDKYLFYLFSSKKIDLENIDSKAFGKSLNSKYLKEEIKIPLPPPDVQRQIADECGEVDAEVEQARLAVISIRMKIEEIMRTPHQETTPLNEVAENISDIVDPNKNNGEVIYVGLENIEKQTSAMVGNTQSDFSAIKSGKHAFEKGDILYGKLRPNLNKVHLAETNGVCSTDILVFRLREPGLAVFYKHFFLSSKFNSEVLNTVTGQQLPRTSWEKINRIPVPSVTAGKKLVKEIEALESKMIQTQAIIDGAPDRKNAILARYL